MMKGSLSLLSAVLFSVMLSSVEATCYHPDGSPIDKYFEPCNTTAEHSMCCHLGVSNNNGDACGEGAYYGLCGVTGTQLWRESCTDQTWKDPACLPLCTYGDGYTGDAMITRCEDGSYCCGENNATCCSAGDGVRIVSNLIVSAHSSTTSSASKTASKSSSVSSSSTASKSSASSSSTPSASSTPSNDPSASKASTSSLSTGAKAGIGIGVAALVIVVVIAVGFFLWKRREAGKKDAAALSTAPAVMAEETKYVKTAAAMPYHDSNASEADSRHWQGHEADSGAPYGGYQRAELS